MRVASAEAQCTCVFVANTMFLIRHLASCTGSDLIMDWMDPIEKETDLTY